MNRIPKRLFQSLAIIAAGICVGLGAYHLKTNPLSFPKKSPVPTPSWQEQTVILTDIEQATMSADFSEEFETALIAAQETPTPELVSSFDIPANQAGDIQPPTLTITGGPADGATIRGTSACFPLWVSDNRTPWKQLATRAQLDSQQWSPWMNYFSYCFDNLGEGRHTVRIQIKDLAGNVSPEVKRTFIVKR